MCIIPTSHKGSGSLTAVIQHKVILGIAVLLRTTGYKYVIISEEVLQGCDLKEKTDAVHQLLT